MTFTETPSSSNVHSVAHEGDEMQVRYKHSKCNGAGCEGCKNTGHTGTYSHAGVSPELFAKVSGSGSVGAAINEHIKKAYPATKL